VTLRNQNHSTTFLSKIVNFYQTDILSDVTVSCDDNFFKCHALVLCASSKLFGRILQSQQSHSSVVHLVGVRGDVLGPILQYIYTGQIEVEEEMIEEMIKVSDELCIEGLSKDNIISEQSKKENRNSILDGSYDIFQDFTCEILKNLCTDENIESEVQLNIGNKTKAIEEIVAKECINKANIDKPRLNPVNNMTKNYSTIKPMIMKDQCMQNATPVYRKLLKNRRENLIKELEITKKLNFEDSEEDDIDDIPPTPQQKQVRKMRSKISKPRK